MNPSEMISFEMNSFTLTNLNPDPRISTQNFDPKNLNSSYERQRPHTLSKPVTGSDRLNPSSRLLAAKQFSIHLQLLTRLSNVSHLEAVEVSRSFRRAELRAIFITLLCSWDGNVIRVSTIGRAVHHSDPESWTLRFVPVSLYISINEPKKMSTCGNMSDFLLLLFIPKLQFRVKSYDKRLLVTKFIASLSGCNRLRLAQLVGAGCDDWVTATFLPPSEN